MCFIIFSCEPLDGGDAGSIVYVLDESSGYYRRVGLFVGQYTMPVEYGRPVVYQAIVLSQALIELQSLNPHLLSNLRVAGEKRCKESTSDVSHPLMTEIVPATHCDEVAAQEKAREITSSL